MQQQRLKLEPKKEENSRAVSRDNSNNHSRNQSLLAANQPKRQLRVSDDDNTHRRQGSDTKGKQTKATSPFTQIKQLYVGLEDWTVKVRVMFVTPAKTFINKKGQ